MKLLVTLVAFVMVASAFGHDGEIVCRQESKGTHAKPCYRQKDYFYTYIDRSHTKKEIVKDLSFIFAAASVLYPLTQPTILSGEDGSWSEYKNNFGKVVFDLDEPFWNFIVHPYTGSQMYLYYRSNGYDRMSSFGMTFLSSLLFEFTIEIYSEPASVQDLYNTPVIGTLLGMGIETLSMAFLNSGNPAGKFFGHLLNPSTLFWWYDGKIQITPQIGKNGPVGLHLMMDF